MPRRMGDRFWQWIRFCVSLGKSLALSGHTSSLMKTGPRLENLLRTQFFRAVATSSFL